MGFTIERSIKLKAGEIEDLCDATEAAVREGIGFNWVMPPSREVLESYWRGVLVIPERVLFIGRLDGVVAAAVQLVKPGKQKESRAFAVQIENHFVAPWARGHGMAKALLLAAEAEARAQGYIQSRLSVRATQEAAIQLYQSNGYECWGVMPTDERIGEHFVAGHYFFKSLSGER